MENKLAPISRKKNAFETVRMSAPTIPRPTTTASISSLPKMNMHEKRPQTTSTSRSGNTQDVFDDKTYITLLKSDVLLTQKRINDIIPGKNTTESILGNYNFSFNRM